MSRTSKFSGGQGDCKIMNEECFRIATRNLNDFEDFLEDRREILQHHLVHVVHFEDEEDEKKTLEQVFDGETLEELEVGDEAADEQKLELNSTFTPKLLPSIEASPKVELKELPDHLTYAFLGKDETLPVIISSKLS